MTQRCALAVLATLLWLCATNKTWAESDPCTATAIETLTICVTPSSAVALRDALLPDPSELQTRNAAPLYERALQKVDHSPDYHRQLNDWLNTPLDQVPLDEICRTNPVPSVFHEAARCDHCDWGIPPQELTLDNLAPSIETLIILHRIAQINSVHTRLAIKEGRCSAAMHNIRTNLLLARHLAQDRTAVEMCIGLSLARRTLDQLRNLIQHENTPNLYWALTALPQPFTNLNAIRENEQLLWDNTYPLYPDAKQRPLSQTEALALWNKFCRTMVVYDPNDMALISKAYPFAKNALPSQGYTTEQIEAMPRRQAILLYWWGQNDEICKAMSEYVHLPYHQGMPQITRIEHQFGSKIKALNNSGYIYIQDFTALYCVVTRFERDLAALRSVEALRLYATNHNGQLPPALAGIPDIAVPIDPITGKPFAYRIDNGKAILESPALYDREGLHWEVTIKKP